MKRLIMNCTQDLRKKNNLLLFGLVGLIYNAKRIILQCSDGLFKDLRYYTLLLEYLIRIEVQVSIHSVGRGVALSFVRDTT